MYSPEQLQKINSNRSSIIFGNLKKDSNNLPMVSEEMLEKAMKTGKITVYTEQGLKNYTDDIYAQYIEKQIGKEDVEKAKKNIAKLQKVVKVDKNGKKTTVYVDPHKDDQSDNTPHKQAKGDEKNEGKTGYKSETKNKQEGEEVIKRMTSMLNNPKSPASMKKRAEDAIDVEKKKWGGAKSTEKKSEKPVVKKKESEEGWKNTKDPDGEKIQIRKVVGNISQVRGENYDIFVSGMGTSKELLHSKEEVEELKAGKKPSEASLKASRKLNFPDEEEEKSKETKKTVDKQDIPFNNAKMLFDEEPDMVAFENGVLYYDDEKVSPERVKKLGITSIVADEESVTVKFTHGGKNYVATNDGNSQDLVVKEEESTEKKTTYDKAKEDGGGAKNAVSKDAVTLATKLGSSMKKKEGESTDKHIERVKGKMEEILKKKSGVKNIGVYDLNNHVNNAMKLSGENKLPTSEKEYQEKKKPVKKVEEKKETTDPKQKLNDLKDQQYKLQKKASTAKIAASTEKDEATKKKLLTEYEDTMDLMSEKNREYRNLLEQIRSGEGKDDVEKALDSLILGGGNKKSKSEIALETLLNL